jgi:hypothetical protein
LTIRESGGGRATRAPPPPVLLVADDSGCAGCLTSTIRARDAAKRNQGSANVCVLVVADESGLDRGCPC